MDANRVVTALQDHGLPFRVVARNGVTRYSAGSEDELKAVLVQRLTA
jgi:hypothetical protein